MSNDQQQQFKGFAAVAPEKDLEPFSYTPRPLGPEDIEIKITHSGICGSDIHTIDSGWGPTPYPVIVGHEIIGEVTARGANVKDLEIGDRVGVGAQQWACLEKGCQECDAGHEQCCRKMLWTYGSVRPEDGSVTQGGYADRIRVRHQFAFRIPAEIDSTEAAPLLCAGLTTYAPLAREKIGKGTGVGVVGIGGLGHLAIRYAAAMGANVTAISTSSRKRADAEELGATKFVTSDTLDKHSRTLDVLVIAGNGKGQDWNVYLSLLKVHGKLILVALPEEPIELRPSSLAYTQVSLGGSLIGSITEMKEMLAFSAKHNIRPMIEVLPMSQVNVAIAKVRKGDVRYRVVMDASK